jgi:excisionase family DNA binding protein
VHSPDFGFFFAVPEGGDASRWIALTLDQARHEIERRLRVLDSTGEDAPVPKRPAEIQESAPKDLVSIREVAELLGTSPDTVRRLADRKQLESWETPGGHRRFSREKVLLYLKARGHAQDAESPTPIK